MGISTLVGVFFAMWCATKALEGVNKEIKRRKDEEHKEKMELKRIEAGFPEIMPRPKAKPAAMNKWLMLSLCVIYIVVPTDLVPDVIPVAGWGDDVVAGIIAIRALFYKG